MKQKQIEDNVKVIYNNMGESYSKKEKANWQDKKYAEKFLSYLSGDKILDIGCGTGELLRFYSEQKYSVSGVELSEVFLEHIRSDILNAKLYNLSAFDIDKLDELYDGISATYLLVHITKNKINEFILKIKNRLNTNGIIFLVFTDKNVTNNPNIINYSMDEVKEVLLSNRFMILEETTFNKEYDVNILIAKTF